MITGLQIRNFRGLKDVTFRELRRINLLVGGNDTGKTSVLEALILLLGDGSQVRELPFTFRNNQSGRQAGNNLDDKENFWSWLFYDRNSDNEIGIIAEMDSNQMLSLTTHTVLEGNYPNAAKIPVLVRSDGVRPKAPVDQFGNYQPNPAGGPQPVQELIRFERNQINLIGRPSPTTFQVSRLSVRPSDPVQDAEKYNQISLESEGEHRFEQIMREVEPRLKRLRYAKLPGTTSPLVFADIGLSRAVPATQMGQAFNRILHIYAEILTSKTNVLLIDEIENGIFSESLPLIWKGLLAVCEQQQVQIFATTHSRECVMAANSAAHERGKDELSVQRLQIVKGKIEAVRLGVQHLEVASEMGLEVRS
jgi:hypothetical protein